jgi:predicted permease
MREFLVVSSLVYGFLILGWGARKTRPALQRHSKRLSRLTLLFLETPAIVMVYWGLEIDLLLSHIRLPIIAVSVFSVSGLAGYTVARLYRLNRSRTGVFTVASMFSNVGMTLGGFLCLLYLGDDGLELSQIYMLAAVPYFFTVVLLTARFFSPAKERGLWKAFKKNFQDPVSLLPLGAILAGLSLTALGVPFPSILQLPRRVVVYATVAAFSASFGLNMYVRRMLGNVIRLVGMLPIKFLLAPAAGFLISLALGYSLNTNPLALKVVIIQSTMPVAIWSVLACKLFDLDDNYAIGLWILTTLCVIFLLPLYSWIAAL